MPSWPGGSSPRYMGRASLRAANQASTARDVASQAPALRRRRSTDASIAAFKKNASTVGAGPLMVIDTDVDDAVRSKPEYRRLASSRQQTETPALPTLP